MDFRGGGLHRGGEMKGTPCVAGIEGTTQGIRERGTYSE